jgi:tryptophan-rich sensory protein
LDAAPVTLPRARDALGLAAFLALAFGVLVLGGLAVGPAIAEWYPALRKPSWTPPGWVFGPVWTLLYPVVAVAGWRVWREGRRRTGMLLYLVQLALNAAWPWLFFAERRPGLALVDVVALFVAIVATAVAFWRVHRGAALLLLPYLGWVGFAAALNHAIWRLNPGG